MARAKKEEIEVAEEIDVTSSIDTVEEVGETTEVTYELNGVNYTAVGDNFITLCNPKITINTSDKALIKSAEEQVKLKVLKKLQPKP